ncbi:hypothetical protein H8S90_13855 [Olivibacter sp. SDN3]|uniref:MauE/DoxX family redox-associated membrane protein n=1 Tax=Olivibacter sp. SDN3 TaxID=2764720 RepID=UPI0016518164|nr:MauE/DoxX family redox-associated membrane protein [Olivibacter sp. SDN3]QNL47903.1 hypothetical protein H8S90_13855 [Olivibacter sp. SDN3]
MKVGISSIYRPAADVYAGEIGSPLVEITIKKIMKININRKEIVVLIATSLLIILFTYTAVNKILEYEKFVFQMRLAPVRWMIFLAPWIGVLIPAIELFLVALLFIDKYRPKGLLGSAALLMIFELYIVGMLLSGLDLPCTCGGIISKMSWEVHLLFNAAFTGLAIYAFCLLKQINKKNNIQHTCSLVF